MLPTSIIVNDYLFSANPAATQLGQRYRAVALEPISILASSYERRDGNDADFGFLSSHLGLMSHYWPFGDA